MPILFVPFLPLLFGLAGVALSAAWSPQRTSIDAQPNTLPTVRTLAQPAASRCAHCGWIESKRQVLPETYEYTVRMANGSSSVFLETLPVSWRLGERLMVIGGTGPLD